MKSEDTRFETCIVNSVACSVYINGEQARNRKKTIFVFYCNVIFNREDSKSTKNPPFTTADTPFDIRTGYLPTNVRSSI